MPTVTDTYENKTETRIQEGSDQVSYYSLEHGPLLEWEDQPNAKPVESDTEQMFNDSRISKNASFRGSSQTENFIR